MATDEWLALAASVFLLISLVAQVPALVKGTRTRTASVVVIVARASAALLLVLVMVTSNTAFGEWLLFNGPLAAIGLVLAMLIIDQMLAWRTGADGAGLVLDLLSVILILLGASSFLPASAPLDCAQRALPSRIEWLLLLVGVGATLVAGSSGLMLGLHGLLGRHSGSEGAPARNQPYCYLKRITMLSALLLGAGLTAAVWWMWRTGASLAGGDPRLGWMAVAWLVTGAGLVAWQLGRRAARWAAALAVLAGAVALFGYLIGPELVRAM